MKMKKAVKQILAIVLTVVMLLGIAPLGNLAGLNFSTKASALASSGQCGADVTYTFDSSTGLLIISGTGAMSNYNYRNTPFYNDTSIKSVIINNGVTSIGNYAFQNCTSLTSVTIPDSVMSIGKSAFESCKEMKSISIPNAVTKIDIFAFQWCQNLKKIELSTNITSIEEGAFWGCNSLTDIILPSSLTSIGEYAFCECYSLLEINIPNSVTSIGVSAFAYCVNLKNISIPNGITKIEDFTFSNCERLTSVFIPNNVTCVGEYAFGFCKSLISISIPNSVVYILNCAFYNSGLKNITISNGITNISDSVFEGCGNLESVTIPNSVINIGKRAFYNCYNLKSIAIPESITNIGNEAFAFCNNLSSINIPNSVAVIEDLAFRSCFTLKSIELPESIIYIGSRVFDNCSGLQRIIVNDNNSIYDSRNDCNAIIETETNILIRGCQNTIIPNGIVSISNGAFCGSTELTQLIIPDTVIQIGEDAFEYTGLTSISIPDCVTEIKPNAFVNLDELTIYCNKDSYAHRYAMDNGFDYVLLDEPELYTITYNGNGGSNVPAEQTKEKDVDITLSTKKPVKDGYSFVGWSTDKNAASAQYAPGAKISENSDLTLYAVWKANSYTVKFYDGSTLLGSKKLRFDEASTLSYGEIPAKKGYKFVGWSIINGGPALFSNGQSIKGLAKVDGATVSYYAAWEKLGDDVLADSETGIVVEVPSGTYSDNVILKVEKVLSGSAFDIVQEQVDGGKPIVFSIDTYVNDVKTQPDGNVTVKIPVPAGFNASKCKLFYVNTEKEILENIPFTVKDGYIVFVTNHFSNWAIVETKGTVKSVSINDVELRYKDSAKLNPKIEVDSGVKYTVEYKSSNPKVATVDNNGNVKGVKEWGKKTATITCTVTDEYGNQVSDTCNVKVGYAWWQWIIGIVLFGWIWY